MQLRPRTNIYISVDSTSRPPDFHQPESQVHPLPGIMAPTRNGQFKGSNIDPYPSVDPPIKPDPDLEGPIDLSILGKQSTRAGFRVVHLQDAVGLNDQEFRNFKEQIRILRTKFFNSRLVMSAQPDAMDALQNALLEEFPTVMKGDTAVKQRCVALLVQKIHGHERHLLKVKIGSGSENGRNIIGDDLDDPPSLLDESMDTDTNMAQGLRGLSVSTPSELASSRPTETISTPTPPSSSQTGSRPSCSSLGLMSFSDTSNINKRTTASLSPPESPSAAIIKGQANRNQSQKKVKSRRRSPSIELLASPPAGLAFPPANAKRRKKNSEASVGSRVAIQSQSPQQSNRPKRTTQWVRPPRPSDSPSKRRQTTSTVDSCSSPGSINSSSTGSSSSSSILRPPFASFSFIPPPNTTVPDGTSAHSKEEILSKYSRGPGLGQAGILFFLRSCSPSMEEFFPAFVALGCTLPNLKGVSTWPEQKVEQKWVPWLKENIERLRKGSKEEAGLTSGGGITSNGQGRMEGIEGTAVTGDAVAGMRELTAMDGLLLGQHLKEFWQKYC